MFKTWRRFLAGLAVLAVTTACGAGGSAGGEGGTQTIDVGYIADYNGAALLAIADDQGLWAKAGLEPNYKKFTDGPLTIQALGGGDIHVGYIGPGALWLPASGRAEVWSVNSVSKADRVIAQPGITSIEDLRGKKVGVPEGTSGDLLLRMALSEAGMTKEDVETVPMDPSTVVSAFSSGQIDAAGLWYPLIETIKGSVPDLNELASNEDFMPEQTFPSTFVAQKGLAEENPEMAGAFISVIQQANDFRHANTEETVDLTAEFLDVPAEELAGQAEVAKTYTTEELVTFTEDGTVAGWFSGIQELFVAVGTIEEVTDPSTFYTADAYLDAARSASNR